MLRRTVNFYQHLQHRDPAADGHVHLPPTFSPEYAVAADCNYDNALYRYALSALVEAIDTLGVRDPRAAQYRSTLERLVPSPVAPVGPWAEADSGAEIAAECSPAPATKRARNNIIIKLSVEAGMGGWAFFLIPS